METNNRIREENWREEFDEKFGYDEPDETRGIYWHPVYEESIYDFIDSLLKSQREEIIKKIEKIEWFNEDTWEVKKKILSLIKEDI